VTTIEAILLGIIQGLTEFLPISSSGHLKLFQHLIGLSNLDQYLMFDLICHVGTLGAIFLFFREQILIILRYDWKKIGWVVIGTLPLFPLLFILGPLKKMFDRVEYLGFFFIATAFILYLGIVIGRKHGAIFTEPKYPKRDAFLIGIFQAFATLPGISRSGSTISCARMLGWTYPQAVLFSFLLAIPAILGGSALIMLESFISSTPLLHPQLSFLQYLSGFVTSFCVGYFALWLLTRLAAKDQFMVFVWYCLFVGVSTLLITR